MKKVFAFGLAAMLIFSLAAVSSAANNIGYVVDVYPIPLVANEDRVIVASARKYFDGNSIPYGSTLYYPLLGAEKGSESGNSVESGMSNNVTHWVSDSDLVKSVSFKKTWEEGGSAVSSVTIQKRKFDYEAGGEYDEEFLNQLTKAGGTGQYYYFLEIKLADKATTSSSDVYGTVALRKTGTNAFWANGRKGQTTINVDINLSVGYPLAEDTTLTEDLLIYNFSDSGNNSLGTNDEEHITLTGDAGYFLVNTKGQGKTLMSCNLDYNVKVSDKFPRADLNFVTCNGASFRRAGDLFIYADEGTYIYEVNSNGTVSKVNAKYDSDEGAFKLRTSTLGAYVISDITLSTSTASGSASSNDDDDDDFDDDDFSSGSGEIIVIDPGTGGGTTTAPGVTIPVNPGTGVRL